MAKRQTIIPQYGTVMKRGVDVYKRQTFTIIITILQPILWLVLYSAVAGQTMESTGIENYTAFIFPGLVVLVSFSACSSGGIMNYLMKSDGSFYRILIAPIRRSAIVLGQLLETILCTFLEISIMGVVKMCIRDSRRRDHRSLYQPPWMCKS